MLALLAAVPLVALVAAAIDTLAVRMRLPHRELDAQLFLQALCLYLVWTLLACLPTAAWLALRRRAGKTTGSAHAAAVLAFVAAAPVLAHWRLDAYSSLGGDLSGLLSFRPWLGAALALAGLGRVLWGLGRAAARAGPRWVAVTLGASALAAGLVWAPSREAPDPPQAPPTGKPNLLLL